MALDDLMNSVFGAPYTPLHGQISGAYPNSLAAANAQNALGLQAQTSAASRPYAPPRINDPVDIHMVGKEGSPLSLSLRDLALLWGQRFGDQWAHSSKLVGDEFWRVTAYRMNKAGMMECLDASDGAAYGSLYKLKETDADR